MDLKTVFTKPVNDWVIAPDHDKSGHHYKVDGERYPSVTTILGVLDKPALMHWAAQQVALKAQAGFAKYTDMQGNIALPFAKAQEIVEDARKTYREKSETARDLGSEGHRILEEYFLGTPMPAVADEGLHNGLTSFMQLKEQKNMQPVRVEAYLASKRLKVAGTADFIGHVDGQLVVGDWKFSTGIYDEMKFQCAAYHSMIEEMTGKELAGAWVFRFDKKTGEFNPKKDAKFISRDECLKRMVAFCGLVDYYYAVKSLKED